MDTTTSATAKVFDLATAERSIIDRAEFGRLIRKHRAVSVCVFAPDLQRRDVLVGVSPPCFTVKIPAAQALERLASGEFDAFVWDLDEYGPHICAFQIAPAWLQLARRRELCVVTIAELERRLASGFWHEDQYCYRDLDRAQLERSKARLADLEARIAARRTQPVAA